MGGALVSIATFPPAVSVGVGGTSTSLSVLLELMAASKTDCAFALMEAPPPPLPSPPPLLPRATPGCTAPESCEEL